MAGKRKSTLAAAGSLLASAAKRTKQAGIGKWVKKGAGKPAFKSGLVSKLSSVAASLTSRKTQYVTIKPGGATTSVFSHKSPCPKYMKQIYKEVMPQMYVTNGAGRTTAPTGQQALATYVGLLGSGTAGDFVGTSASDMQQLLSQIYSANPTGAQKTTRLYIKSMLTNMTMTNNQTNNMFVDIYDVVARRDGTVGLVGAFDQGLKDQGLTTGYTAINIVPQMSQTFNQHWKVLKKTSIELAPGMSHRHISSLQFNKAWNAERLQDAVYHFNGLTSGIMVVIWGAPDHDATNVNNVSTGSCLLDTVYSRQIMYTYVQPQINTTKYVGNLPTITTERAVNPESGVPGTVAS